MQSSILLRWSTTDFRKLNANYPTRVFRREIPRFKRSPRFSTMIEVKTERIKLAFCRSWEHGGPQQKTASAIVNWSTLILNWQISRLKVNDLTWKTWTYMFKISFSKLRAKVLSQNILPWITRGTITVFGLYLQPAKQSRAYLQNRLRRGPYSQ